MIEKAKAAKSAEELLALAKEYNIEMTADEAKIYYAQLNPKSGELDDDDLDAVAGGACGKKPTPKFAVGDHVIERGLYNCDGGLFGNCQSRYWVVDAFIDYGDVHGIHYRCSCPVCGIVIDISESSLLKVD